ncbi:TPA: Phr family secreted Rap phosphatase inhibitor [Bacillus pacificus]|nr:Phr family secreted Rap phosphatase inhibitor [Bacillus pacificus]
MKKLKLALLSVVSVAVLSIGFSQTVTKEQSALPKEEIIVKYSEPGMGI